jgi:uncharacterized protein YegP (UPF0339 family)
VARGTITIYQGEDGQWYWRYQAGNHRISAAGGEGFVSKSNAKRAARKVGLGMALAKVVMNG